MLELSNGLWKNFEILIAKQMKIELNVFFFFLFSHWRLCAWFTWYVWNFETMKVSFVTHIIKLYETAALDSPVIFRLAGDDCEIKIKWFILVTPCCIHKQLHSSQSTSCENEEHDIYCIVHWDNYYLTTSQSVHTDNEQEKVWVNKPLFWPGDKDRMCKWGGSKVFISLHL